MSNVPPFDQLVGELVQTLDDLSKYGNKNDEVEDEVDRLNSLWYVIKRVAYESGKTSCFSLTAEQISDWSRDA